MQEIEVLKNIDHPNVVKIEEYFVERHFVYIVFEKVHGFSLDEGMSNIK
jgi:serine/threonine protein kinase